MPTIFRQKNPNSHQTLGPIRGSVKLLIFKIVIIFLVFDFFYFIILNLFNFLAYIDHTFYLTITISLIAIYSLTKLFQIGLIVYSVMLWSKTTYYIDGRHLIVHRGVFSVKEIVYDLATIRSADVRQGFFQQLLNYGDVELKTSASGGYQVVVTLEGISKPIEVEKKINEYF